MEQIFGGGILWTLLIGFLAGLIALLAGSSLIIAAMRLGA